jgi:hypothetical protein
MNTQLDNSIKISESNYIVGDSLEAEYQGNISLCGDTISFFDVEFDSNFVLYPNHFICSKDKTYGTDKEIYSVKGLNEEDNSRYTYKIEEIKHFEFSMCRFKKDVYFNLNDNCSISIDNCIFEKKFSINKDTHPQRKTYRSIKITKVELDNCIFENEFSIESCLIHYYRFIDIDFKGDTNIFNTIFDRMHKNTEEERNGYFNNSTFYKSSIFENIIFNDFIQFKSSTFKEYSLFRNIEFKKGLCLDYSNFEKTLNIYDLKGLNKKESKSKTSKETYRIIKYNLEQNGNKIESNKYHALELEKNKMYLSTNKFKSFSNFRDWLVFSSHNIFSSHSTNWALALFWIFFTSLVTVFSLNYDLIISICSDKSLYKTEYLLKAWNEFWQFIYIGNTDEKLKDSPFIFFFNKVALGYLYYQFLMSVRKDTRK